MPTFYRSHKTILSGLALILLTVFSPNHAFASNSLVASTGVSDESLFMILTCLAVLQVIVVFALAKVIQSIASKQGMWSSKTKKTVATILLLGIVLPAAAETNDFDQLVTLDDTGFMALVLINVTLLFIILFLTSKINMLIRLMAKDANEEVPPTFLEKIKALMTDTVPIEQEYTVEMDHEYDGIRELDNNLPPWWLWGFYLSIVFAVVYMYHYHISGEGLLQEEEYAVAVQEAEQARLAFLESQESTIDESNVEMLSEESDLQAGAKIFRLYCAPCHGENGGSMPGGVGPNLTDDYWLHGGSVTDIFKTVKYGVPEKGMVSWEAQLNALKIQQVASYIKSLRGTDPVNPKEPQGELFIEQSPDEIEIDTLSTDSVEMAVSPQ